MPNPTRKKVVRKPTLTGLNREVSCSRLLIEDFEDAQDLNAAIARNEGKPGTEWKDAKTLLDLE